MSYYTIVLPVSMYINFYISFLIIVYPLIGIPVCGITRSPVPRHLYVEIVHILIMMTWPIFGILSIVVIMFREQIVEYFEDKINELMNMLRLFLHNLSPIITPLRVYITSECSVCLENLVNDESNEPVQSLGCGHLFHERCILNVPRCPMCRS